MEELGIQVFAMGDIDALNKMCDMVEDDNLKNKINGLKGKAAEIGEDGWKQPIIEENEQLDSIRAEVRTKLLDENILVLMGELEDYYPDVGSGKIKTEAALEFSAMDYTSEELCKHFVELPENEKTDVEIFLERVFEKGGTYED